MDNTLNDDFQFSSSGSDKNDEDSFLTLSTKIVTFSSTPSSVCYFQMVESNKSQSPEKDGKKLTLKEKWKQSKLKKLLT